MGPILNFSSVNIPIWFFLTKNVPYIFLSGGHASQPSEISGYGSSLASHLKPKSGFISIFEAGL
jgi:hypothetical protein